MKNWKNNYRRLECNIDHSLDRARIEPRDEYYMREALKLARRAAELGEVPVGAVIVRGEKIIASGRNGRESERNALRHAELTAIDLACGALKGWRLTGCTLYVTLEPCPMCAGAIINSRLSRVVFGAGDPKAGAFGSLLDLRNYPLNHRPELARGVLERECSELLREFFAARRARGRS